MRTARKGLRAARALCRLVVGLLPLFATASCGQDTTSPDGSETHFLSSCDASCGGGTQCVCDVCTTMCAASSECTALSPLAACVSLAPRVAAGRCVSGELTSACDVGCLVDNDCHSLGAAFACRSGFCRRSMPRPPLAGDPASCEGPEPSASELVVLGDSIIELSPFTAELEQLALDAGVLATGEQLRDYSSYLTSFLASGPLGIETEYAKAVGEGPLRFIVMDGGETDVLNVPCGSAPTSDCAAITAAVAGFEALLARAAGDGVEQIVYFFYADPVGNPDVKAGLDVLRPLVENACGRAPLPCHFIDLRPSFAEHPEYAAADGLVFSASGAAAAAATVFERMQQRCVAGY